MIETKTFERKTFRVEAVQVTAENMSEVAEWCKGIKKVYLPEEDHKSGDYHAGQLCIEITQWRHGQKIRAYIGDWITHIDDAENFRVYRDKIFVEAFDEVPSTEIRAKVVEALEELVSEYWPSMFSIDETADKIMGFI